MKRRQLLTTLGTGLAATSGCITTTRSAPDTTHTPTTTTATATDTTTDTTTTTETETTTASDPLDLPAEHVHPLDENVNVDSVLVKTSYMSIASEAKYNNPEKGTIETWDPGNNYMLAFAELWGENLTDDEKRIPNWKNFKMQTPHGTQEPVLETPDGTSVGEIRPAEYVPNVSWPTIDGLEPQRSRGWSAVYTIRDSQFEHIAVKWERRNRDPIYWRYQG